MSDRVLRWTVPVDDEWHEFPCAGLVSAVNCTEPGVVEFWTFERATLIALGLPPRSFRVYGTGHPIDVEAKHCGTAVVPPQFGRLVWHLFERVSR